MSAKDSTRLLTPLQAAKRLGVCRMTIYRLVSRGQLAHERVISNCIGIRASDLAAYQRAHPSRATRGAT